MKMLRSLGLAASLAGSLAISSPALAQDESSRAARALAEAFSADPLNAEQEARLPAAQEVVEKIFPPGTYMKMMEGTLGPVMDSVTASLGAVPMADLIRLTGRPKEELEGLGDATIDEVMAIIDPHFQERQSLMISTMTEWMAGFMNEIEPNFRQGLVRAYAVRFEQDQLEELSAFFQTPTGAYYAGESMLIMMDPQVMSVMGEMMPRMVERMPEMTEAMTAATESFPPPRQIDELSEEERAKLDELLGLTE